MDLTGTQKIIINGRFLTQKKTGVQMYAYEITSLLIKKGLDIIVVMPDAPIFNGYNISGWPLQKISWFHGHLWEQISLPLYLFFTLKTKKEKLLINFCNTAPILFNKNILTLHDVAVVRNPGWFKKWFASYYKLIIPVLLRRAKQIVTVSQFSKSEIQNCYSFCSRRNIEVVYGASSKLPYSNDTNEDAYLTKNNLLKNRYILSLCSLEPRKNLGNLIKAFNKLEIDDLSLVLVGGKGNVFKDNNLDSDNINVRFLGYVSDEQVHILYNNALCFVYPSLYEGFGLPPIQAMSNACPVIVSAIPSLQEVCQDAALFFEPKDIDDIKDKIEMFISDPSLQNRIKEEGLIRADFFSFHQSADQFANIIRKQLN